MESFIKHTLIQFGVLSVVSTIFTVLLSNAGSMGLYPMLTTSILSTTLVIFIQAEYERGTTIFRHYNDIGKYSYSTFIVGIVIFAYETFARHFINYLYVVTTGYYLGKTYLEYLGAPRN